MPGRITASMLSILIAISAATFSIADEVVATDSGFVTELGGSAKGDGTLITSASFNYSVGWEEHYGDGSLGMPPGSTPLAFMERENYFIFDLSDVTSPIVSASLLIYAGPDIGDPFPMGMHGYESEDPFEDFVILETTDPGMALGIADALLAGNTSGMGAPTLFDEASDPLVGEAAFLYGVLGDGAILGEYSLSSSDDGTTISVDFSPFGLGYLNTFVGSRVILAGKLTTIDTSGPIQETFGYTGPDILGGTDSLTPKLTFTTVPEPNALGILTVTGLLLGTRRRRLTKR